MLYIKPYRRGVKAVRQLAKSLKKQGVKCKIVHSSNVTILPNSTLVYVGAAQRLSNEKNAARKLNVFAKRASNKLSALETWKKDKANGVRYIPFTTEASAAQEWLNNGAIVLARRVLAGHSGEGIILYHPKEKLHPDDSNTPLFTQYIKKKAEYRIHVFNGQVIDFQQKKKRIGAEINQYVRSWNNGWIYARENVTPPKDVLEQAKKAVTSLGLDFGAVDVIWNDKQQQAYVLEVNTSPAMEGSTLLSYTKAFSNLMKNKSI